MTLKDSIEEMIAQGKSFEQCEYKIFSEWHISQHEKGYGLLNDALLDGKFDKDKVLEYDLLLRVYGVIKVYSVDLVKDCEYFENINDETPLIFSRYKLVGRVVKCVFNKDGEDVDYPYTATFYKKIKK